MAQTQKIGRLPDWIYVQSGVLPYRLRDGSLEVLLITSRKAKRWVLPKGIVEPGMSAPASAAKEAMEEAGVEGEVSAYRLGKYKQKKWGGTCKIQVFPMKVTVEMPDWPEAATRQRAWLSPEEAAARVDNEGLAGIIASLPEALASGAVEAQISPRESNEQPRVIYLFRHAKSSWQGSAKADFDRPLAARGRRASEAMGNYIRFADLQPDLVLCSASTRCRETLRALVPAIGEDVPVACEDGLYSADAAGLLERLRRTPQDVNSVFVIGHNPAFQALATALAGGGDAEALARLAAKFPTAGLATLVLRRDHWRDLGPETCELHSFVAPRELA